MSVTDNAAVIGGGTTAEFGDLPDRSRLSLAAEALGNALDDAGIDREELDGLIYNIGAPENGVNHERLCEALNLDVDFNAFYWLHGRWVATVVTQAAMAVEAGLADYIAVGLAKKNNLSEQISALTVDPSLSDIGCISECGERPWYGFASPAADAALSARVYMETYGATNADLAHVSVTQRHHASLTPTSHFSEPIDVEDHQSSRWVVEPLRLFDCSPLSDGAAYIIITSAELAESTSNEPAYIAAKQGMHQSRNESSFARPGIGVRNSPAYEYEVPEKIHAFYDRAGLSRDDIDAFYMYDAFSPVVWNTLERYGFCPPGEAYKFTRDGNIGINGSLPVNTHGGLLSNGHVIGYNHLVEMFQQLQGDCGKRQVADAAAVQWVGTRGDSFILRRV